jgi:hypothetical protein
MKLIRTLVAVTLVLAFALAHPAHADTTPSTTITQIKVLANCDPNYRLFHGAIWLEHDKATANYRWGGEHCGGKTLSDNNVGMLFAAFRSKLSVTLDFRMTKYKKRTYRCITGFSITR